jgi:hypothetical protein
VPLFTFQTKTSASPLKSFQMNAFCLGTVCDAAQITKVTAFITELPSRFLFSTTSFRCCLRCARMSTPITCVWTDSHDSVNAVSICSCVFAGKNRVEERHWFYVRMSQAPSRARVRTKRVLNGWNACEFGQVAKR